LLHPPAAHLLLLLLLLPVLLRHLMTQMLHNSWLHP
jgi:hypothetical protein